MRTEAEIKKELLKCFESAKEYEREIDRTKAGLPSEMFKEGTSEEVRIKHCKDMLRTIECRMAALSWAIKEDFYHFSGGMMELS